MQLSTSLISYLFLNATNYNLPIYSPKYDGGNKHMNINLPSIEPGRFPLPALLIVLCVALLTVASAQETPVKPEPPILVTSAGQALDGFTVHTLMERAGLESDYDILAEAARVADYKTLIVVFGASIKGFGAAGITAQTELERTKALLNEARDNNVTLIGVHIGGEERRGGLSEPFVEAVAPAVDILVVAKSGNDDGYFSDTSAEMAIPLLLIDQPLTVGTEIANLF